MNAKDIFRQRLAAELDSRDIPRYKFAEQCGSHHSTLNKVLSGKQCPSLDFAEQLAAGLGMTLHEMLAPPKAVRKRKPKEE